MRPYQDVLKGGVHVPEWVPVLVAWLATGVAGWAFVRFALPWLLARRGVYLERRTKFGPALVFDTQDADGTGVRVLNVGGAFQSASYTSDELRHELVCVYHRVFADALEAAWEHDTPDHRVAVLGGGGYSFPRWLATHTKRAQVEAVEIDPKITELARRFFFLDDAEARSAGRLRCVSDDAWAYLQASDDASFDVIVNDAFSRKRPLGAMRTHEGARIIHEKLTPRGLYLANLISPTQGKKAEPMRAVLRVFAHEFAHVYLVPERPEEPEVGGCNALICSDRPLSVPGALVICP